MNTHQQHIFFLPDKEKPGVCLSLEEWAAQILKSMISTVLNDAITDSKTKTRFERVKKQEDNEITEEDYKMTIDEKEIGVTNYTYNTSPDQNKNKPKEELTLNISTTIKIFWLRQMQNKKK